MPSKYFARISYFRKENLLEALRHESISSVSGLAIKWPLWPGRQAQANSSAEGGRALEIPTKHIKWLPLVIVITFLARLISGYPRQP